MTTALPRDVLKWLQSLELGMPIFNLKRDFANGYLIASIFSRYFPNDINLLSFYTGPSEKLKRSNWSLIEKFLIKLQIKIPREAIEAVMTCQNGAALRFIENVYCLLTNKRLAPRVNTPGSEEPVPHFALPTTSRAIKCMAESPQKAEIVLKAHQEFLKQLRVQRRREKV